MKNLVVSIFVFCCLFNANSFASHRVVCIQDSDGDGYVPIFASRILVRNCPDGYIRKDMANRFDCDDFEASVNSGAEELCGDGLDNDCDGEIDEDCPLDCNDGNECTVDIAVWDGTFSWCAYEINSNNEGCTTALDCDDGNPCTVDIAVWDGTFSWCAYEIDFNNESCTTALDCDDGNPCTADIAVWDGTFSWCAYEINTECE